LETSIYRSVHQMSVHFGKWPVEGWKVFSVIYVRTFTRTPCTW
jgi:hypothetical protein